MESVLSKKQFRSNAIKARDAVTDRGRKSEIIAQKLRDTEVYKNARVVLCYASYKSEVETDRIISNARKDGKKVALPRVEGDRMEFYYIDSMKDTVVSYMGIREPSDNCSKVTDIEAALVVVPGTSFDINLKRNGNGGGFYDRYLSEHSEAVAVGIAFKEQVYEEIPHEEYDVKMDLIVTD